MNSILIDIKQMLGIQEDDISFDKELIIHINTAITVLTQLGIGPEMGFKIIDSTSLWDQLLLGKEDVDSVKNIIYLRCRLSFDPPQSSFLLDSLKKQCEELEWRIVVATSPMI